MFLLEPTFRKGHSSAWYLASECRYLSEELNMVVSVPEGFETDLASIPAFFRRIIPVNDTHVLAAVVHDYLYSVKGKVSPTKTITRKQADKAFLEAMRELKVPVWKRNVMYRAVRMGGWKYWRS